MVKPKDEKVYCHEHDQYKVKNMNGTKVCVTCTVEDGLDGELVIA